MKKQLLILVLIWLPILCIKGQKTPNLAATPPMGWNSWNKFACDVSEDLIKGMADAMVETGMKDAGYEYIVIDDCWQVDRDQNGKIIADPDRFPSGIKALADYVHSKGLKFGIYSDAGRQTCQERPGGYGYEEIDANTYAEWGVDYLKYDWCHHRGINPQESYSAMRDALSASGRDITYSICEWGVNKPWLWADTIGHLWRTTWDIGPKFDGTSVWPRTIMSIVNKQMKIREHSGPNGWNDPDMLEVGNEISLSESRAHFSLWCMLSAPLMAGNDLENMSDEIREILTHQEMIAIDQDPLGISAFKWLKEGKMEVYLKPLEEGDIALCVLNRGKKENSIEISLDAQVADPDIDGASYSLSPDMTIRNVWKNLTIGTVGKSMKVTVPGRDAVVFRLMMLKD